MSEVPKLNEKTHPSVEEPSTFFPLVILGSRNSVESFLLDHGSGSHGFLDICILIPTSLTLSILHSLGQRLDMSISQIGRSLDDRSRPCLNESIGLAVDVRSHTSGLGVKQHDWAKFTLLECLRVKIHLRVSQGHNTDDFRSDLGQDFKDGFLDTDSRKSA